MKLLRKILFPLALLYGGVTAFRNFLYNRGWLKSNFYDFPVICVGNLSTGGTGKTPMIEFLIDFLKEDYKIAVLSRGYKRKTKGFVEVFPDSNVTDVGDEPLQFKMKFPEILVGVCANRQKGISILQKKADVILLDDAFQHRKIRASISILLTPYFDLYPNDCLLPTGNLRESKSGAARAQVVVVTKCPKDISIPEMNGIKEILKLKVSQKLYFSSVEYDSFIYAKNEKLLLTSLLPQPFTLITGIANAKPLTDFLTTEGFHFDHQEFGDHHSFSENELERFRENEILLTTEKDYMRLKDKLHLPRLYYLPITTRFLNDGEVGLKTFLKAEMNS